MDEGLNWLDEEINMINNKEIGGSRSLEDLSGDLVLLVCATGT
jgi:hypothetical protein